MLSKVELVNYYVEALRTSVREMEAHQVRSSPEEERSSITAVRQITAPMGHSERELLKDRANLDNSPSDTKRKAPTKAVMLLPPKPVITEEMTWELKNPSHETDDASIIDIEMGLGSILFANGEVGPPTKTLEAMTTGQATTEMGDKRVIKELLEGDEDRLVLQGQTEAPRLFEAQVRQVIDVIPANYGNLICWTCTFDGHSTFSCAYLTVTQRLYFVQRYYLFQILANPQIET